MQQAMAQICIDGDQGMTVTREITPAEAAILLDLHGREGLKDIKLLDDVERTVAEEAARLRHVYARGTSKDEQGVERPVFAALFPGRAPVLPTSFDQVEIDDQAWAGGVPPYAAAEAAPKKAAPKKAAGKKAAAPEPDDDDEDSALVDQHTDPDLFK